MFNSFLLTESSSEIYELFCLLTFVISARPVNMEMQKFKVGQNFWLEIHVQKAISLSILDEFQQTRAQLKFKLDCVERI